ncbi:MAG: hypothetical protein Q9227_000023 [Pyrenula ochraceoflavens]
MATIRIAEDVHLRGGQRHDHDGASCHSNDSDLIKPPLGSQDDGIYNIRARRMSRDKTLHRTSSTDDDPGLRREGDYKHSQIFSGKILLWLAYQSIGVIYGDIGTSPLYVYSSTFSSAPSYIDLIGALSIIIWSLTLMVTVKYVLIILRADNDGEGGTFSTYALLSRYMNITNRDPREASLVKMKRFLSGDLESAGRQLRKGFESSRLARNLLKVIGCLAVTMVLSDGVLTPAQSVLGAVQGIEVVAPNISKGTIVGVTDAILVMLFLVQPLGIQKISYAFSPIVIIWLGFNAAFGVYNLVNFDATVFKAFNPGYAFNYLIQNKESGWRSLGGILLAFTGVEALFADLGAFSRRAIQLSWLCYTFPCLLLAYIGQAAYISRHPDAYSNPFFNAAPPGTVYPALVIAILAAIVASQAIITATFQVRLSGLSSRNNNSDYLAVTGPSHEAIIFPSVEGCAHIQDLPRSIFVWRFSPYVVFLPWLTIACLDGTFFSSALTKVPDGAWFTLTLAAILAAVFLLWRFGKEQQWFAEAEDRFPTKHFIRTNQENGQLCLAEKYDGTPLGSIKQFGIFFDKAGETTPIVFSQFALKINALPDVMVFFHLRPLETPSVAPEERHAVSRLAIPGCYRLVVRYGYNDEVITPDLAGVIYEQIRAFILRAEKGKQPALLPNGDITELMDAESAPPPVDEKADEADGWRGEELAILDRAFSRTVLYVIGKEHMRIKPETNLLRKTVLRIFLWIRDNTRTKMANLNVPGERIVEVGFLKEI